MGDQRHMTRSSSSRLSGTNDRMIQEPTKSSTSSLAHAKIFYGSSSSVTSPHPISPSKTPSKVSIESNSMDYSSTNQTRDSKQSHTKQTANPFSVLESKTPSLEQSATINRNNIDSKADPQNESHGLIEWGGRRLEDLPCFQNDLSAFIVDDEADDGKPELQTMNEDNAVDSQTADQPGKVNEWAFVSPSLMEFKASKNAELSQLRMARQGKSSMVPMNPNNTKRNDRDGDLGGARGDLGTSPDSLATAANNGSSMSNTPYSRSSHSKPSNMGNNHDTARKKRKRKDSIIELKEELEDLKAASVAGLEPTVPNSATNRSRKNDNVTLSHIPAYGPDFIVDDLGDASYFDPLYSHLPPSSVPYDENDKPYLRNPKLRYYDDGEEVEEDEENVATDSVGENFLDDTMMDVERHESFMPVPTSRAPMLPRTRPPPAQHQLLQVDERSNSSSSSHFLPPPRSLTPSSVGSLNNSVGGTSYTTASAAAMPATPSINSQKIRVMVAIKDRKFVIPSAPDSTISWLQSEVSRKYKLLTKIVIEIDHTSTPAGAMFFPDDCIGDVLNDSESVICVIKEAQPLGMADLYRGDCMARSIDINPRIERRLTEEEEKHRSKPTLNSTTNSNIINNGLDTTIMPSAANLWHPPGPDSNISGPIHLDLSELKLNQLNISTLHSILNLHSIESLNLSQNELDTEAAITLFSEISKCPSTPSTFKEFDISKNNLGLNIPIHQIQLHLPSFSSLTKLNFGYNLLNDEAIGNLVPELLNHCPKLVHLNLECNFFGSIATGMWRRAMMSKPNPAGTLSSLLSLNVSRNPISSMGLLDIVEILSSKNSDPLQLPRIQEMDLGYCSIDFHSHQPNTQTPQRCLDLLLNHIPSLTKISLVGQALDFSQSHTLLFTNMCLGLAKMTYVDLTYCKLKLCDVVYLKLLASSTLKTLKLDHNDFGIESGTSIVQAFISNPNSVLNVLSLIDCKFSSNDIQVIRESLKANRDIHVQL